MDSIVYSKLRFYHPRFPSVPDDEGRCRPIVQRIVIRWWVPSIMPVGASDEPRRFDAISSGWPQIVSGINFSNPPPNFHI